MEKEKYCPFTPNREICDDWCPLYIQEKEIVRTSLIETEKETKKINYEDVFTGCAIKMIALKGGD